MKLTYWAIPNIGDSCCYDIRAKTRKEALQIYNSYVSDPCMPHKDYDINELEKIVLEYGSGFELLNECLGESRGRGIQIN